LKRRLYLLFAQNDLMETKADDHIFVVVIKIPEHEGSYNR
jgi:hypothetical protein